MYRDPRYEPNRGYRVRVKGRVRQVTDVRDGDIKYITETQANAHERVCCITTWRQWATKGIIL